MCCAGQVWCTVNLVKADSDATFHELVGELCIVLGRVRYVLTPMYQCNG